MPKVSAVIVNYQNDQQTKALSESLRTLGPIQEVIVIDNSVDNRGFARAANIGINQAISTSDYILLINPDVNFEISSFQKFLTDPPADISSPVIKFSRNNKAAYDFGGKINWVLGRADHVCKPLQQIDYVSGACMLVKKGVFQKIGFFDEKYFLYFEDVDFCLRAKRAGFTITVDLNTTVEHQIQEHRFSKNRFKIYQNFKSNWLFIWDYVPWYFKPISICFLGIIALKSFSRALFKN